MTEQECREWIKKTSFIRNSGVGEEKLRELAILKLRGLIMEELEERGLEERPDDVDNIIDGYPPETLEDVLNRLLWCSRYDIQP